MTDLRTPVFHPSVVAAAGVFVLADMLRGSLHLTGELVDATPRDADRRTNVRRAPEVRVARMASTERRAAQLLRFRLERAAEGSVDAHPPSMKGPLSPGK
jgi:hypothetical protein